MAAHGEHLSFNSRESPPVLTFARARRGHHLAAGLALGASCIRSHTRDAGIKPQGDVGFEDDDAVLDELVDDDEEVRAAAEAGVGRRGGRGGATVLDDDEEDSGSPAQKRARDGPVELDRIQDVVRARGRARSCGPDARARCTTRRRGAHGPRPRRSRRAAFALLLTARRPVGSQDTEPSHDLRASEVRPDLTIESEDDDADLLEEIYPDGEVKQSPGG